MTPADEKRIRFEVQGSHALRATNIFKELYVDEELLLSEIDTLRGEVERLRSESINLKSTIAAWDHAEIIKCGCKYNRVWGGLKWEHWLVPCAGHREALKEKRDA